MHARRPALPLAALLLVVACEGPPAGPIGLHLVQANIGNALLSCGDGYVYKLCERDVEARIRDGLAALAPDVVVLQEVLAPGQCDAFEETDAARTCHPDASADEPSQARRLLGPEFTIVCDQRTGYECVGVRTSFARVKQCPDGEQCYAARTAPAVDDCSTGFSVSGVEIEPPDATPFTLVNGHPDSNPGGRCRAAQLTQLFEDDDAIAADARTLLAGDFNLDPDLDNDPSVGIWVQHVGMEEEALRFRYHSGHAERSPPYPTSPTVLGDRVIDHVASDFATGVCTTLGEAPGTTRLDGGEGTDHRALSCALELAR